MLRFTLPEKKTLVHEMVMPIRWGDMDAMGHVNNTNYFRYMESVRIEALIEGETKGRMEGELIGRIESFQEILGIAEPTHDELSGFDIQKLTALCDQLRSQIRSRSSD